jgi:predicted DNA binding protein
MIEGYFDVPRRISLTRLATKVGVATSTLSVTLALIEKKILEPHL